jgi:polyhydroxyalkanoate synthesis regulator phasin
MPQPRRTSSRRSQGSRSSGGGQRSTARSSGGAKRSTARSSGGGAKRSSGSAAKRSSGSPAKRSSGSAAKRGGTSQRKASTSGARKPAARKSAARKTTARKSTSQRRTPRPAAPQQLASGLEPSLRRGLSTMRDLLARGVVLSGERLQETMDDAVERGRVTRSDAEDLVQRLLEMGRRQTEEVLSDLEQLLGRGARGGDVVSSVRQAGERARSRAGSVAKQARSATAGDRVLREVDRARRAAGLGQSFPILGYDDLSAAQVTDRLGDLTPAELRKVRDHERRHANRKSVLDSVEAKLR